MKRIISGFSGAFDRSLGKRERILVFPLCLTCQVEVGPFTVWGELSPSLISCIPSPCGLAGSWRYKLGCKSSVVNLVLCFRSFLFRA
jgi:hypothetical protein